jgi:predicted flap endonuclease-1-like 5' DNA nuclease
MKTSMTIKRSETSSERRARPLRWWLGVWLGVGLAYWLAQRWLALPSLARDDETSTRQPSPRPKNGEPAPEEPLPAPAARPPAEDLAAPLAAEAAATAGEEPAKPAAEPDDLAIIDGIGPVRVGQLRRLGITTFAELAAANAETLRAAAREAGFNFNLGNPESWIEQAKAQLPK